MSEFFHEFFNHSLTCAFYKPIYRVVSPLTKEHIMASAFIATPVRRVAKFKAKPRPEIDRNAVSDRMFGDFKRTFDGLAK